MRRNRKVLAPWSMADTVNLIEHFKCKPELWDKNLEEYRDRMKRVQCIRNIADEMNRDMEDVNNKWQNLRSQFNSELRKAAKQRDEQNAFRQYVSRWDYFDMMQFMLLPISEKRSSTDAAKHNTPRQNFESIIFGEVNDANDSNLILEYDSPPDLDLTYAELKKPRIYDHSNIKENDTTESIGPIQDEYSAFGEYIAYKLRKLSSARLRATAQNRISNYLFKLEMEDDEFNEDDNMQIPMATTKECIDIDSTDIVHCKKEPEG